MGWCDGQKGLSSVLQETENEKSSIWRVTVTLEESKWVKLEDLILRNRDTRKAKDCSSKIMENCECLGAEWKEEWGADIYSSKQLWRLPCNIHKLWLLHESHFLTLKHIGWLWGLLLTNKDKKNLLFYCYCYDFWHITVNKLVSTVLQQVRTKGKEQRQCRKSIVKRLNPHVLVKSISIRLSWNEYNSLYPLPNVNENIALRIKCHLHILQHSWPQLENLKGKKAIGLWTHFFTYSSIIVFFKRNKQENVHKWERELKQIIITKLLCIFGIT